MTSRQDPNTYGRDRSTPPVVNPSLPRDPSKEPATRARGQVQSFLAAMRKQQSGTYEGDYAGQGDDQIGAYGINMNNWNGYANAAGMGGANWRDARAQDQVVRMKVSEDYERYGGNWLLVATAWYAGQDATDRIAEKGGTIENIRSIAGDAVADFAQGIFDHGSGIGESEWGLANGAENLLPVNDGRGIGMTAPGVQSNKPPTGSTTQAADMVRQRLQALAAAGGNMETRSAASDPSEWEDTSEFTRVDQYGSERTDFSDWRAAHEAYSAGTMTDAESKAFEADQDRKLGAISDQQRETTRDRTVISTPDGVVKNTVGDMMPEDGNVTISDINAMRQSAKMQASQLSDEEVKSGIIKMMVDTGMSTTRAEALWDRSNG